MDSTAEVRRLRWQCRRGLLELDLLLGGFLERHYPALAPHDQEAFRRLLREPDPRLLAWFQGQERPPDELKHIVEILSQ
jgi:antitoxin CptB